MIINATALEPGNTFVFPRESALYRKIGRVESVSLRMNLSNHPIVVVSGVILDRDGDDFVWFALPHWQVTI